LAGQTRPRRVETQPDPETRADYQPAAGNAAIVIAYAAFGEAFRPEPVVPKWSFNPPAASSESSAKAMMNALAGQTRAPFPIPANVISTAPMTVGEKFHTWFKGHFLSIGAYVGPIPRGMWSELNDNDDFKEDTFANFMADSLTRAARSYANGTTNAFYEKAVLASILKQDPRYHRSTKTTPGAKLLYAVTRVLVTQGDNCACNQPNISFLLGGATGAVTTNLWERSERTGPVHTVKRWGNHILFTAIGHIFAEFLSGQ
jgi:hypothetical protein